MRSPTAIGRSPPHRRAAPPRRSVRPGRRAPTPPPRRPPARPPQAMDAPHRARRRRPRRARAKDGAKRTEFRPVRSGGQPHAIMLAMARALGRYELLRPLARGGMAEVYLARRRAAGVE